MNESASIHKNTGKLSVALAGEGGYTLLETVVAMAIFVGVLIPIVAAIGNFMLDGSADQMRCALREAQTEIARVSINKTFTDSTRTSDQGLIVSRRVKRTGNLVDINVEVASSKKPDKVILKLHKSVLSYK